MLPKNQRLSGKDINYMLKKGKRIYGDLVTFRVIKQYPQRKYSQRGVQVPLKVDKRASMRNMLKRKAYDLVGELFDTKWGSSSGYYKVFVVVNKKKADGFKDIIETADKSAILEYWTSAIKNDFAVFKRSCSQHRLKNGGAGKRPTRKFVKRS